MKFLLTRKIVRIVCIVLLSSFQFSLTGTAQNTATVTTQQAHSHNDYEQRFAFWSAYYAGFGSIEVDIFLEKGQLIVAHDQQQVAKGRTLDSLYLKPLLQVMQENGGSVYKNPQHKLQLLIDIKTAAEPTLNKLVAVLKEYPTLLKSSSLQLVISGNRPAVADFKNYPEWLSFDGDLSVQYDAASLKKIALFSDNFKKYTNWNGKGRLPETEYQQLSTLVKNAHHQGKKIRFWNAPDIVNSWYAYIEMGVDFINTDHIEQLSGFLATLPNRYYTADAGSTHQLYHPTYKNDGENKPIKNVILLIGDGTGLAQWYAGYTTNNQALNVFNMRQIGLSKTSSFNNYITDSAPGATAFSSGKKTNNRAVGVDPQGKPLPLLTEYVARKGMKTGIITTGDMRDATPASFYAHQSERSNYTGILKDLLAKPVDLLVGSGDIMKDTIMPYLQQKFAVYNSVKQANWKNAQPIIINDSLAAARAAKTRDNWTLETFTKSLERLSKNADGFFLMFEAAQIDHGGHANELPVVASELKDFDKVIGAAMTFADKNGETLIVITGDHETGGLTLTAGDYSRNFISGQFSTGDHTAIPVPVFSYGPQSQLFRGVYENTEIFHKLLQALQLKQ